MSRLSKIEIGSWLVTVIIIVIAVHFGGGCASDNSNNCKEQNEELKAKLTKCSKARTSEATQKAKKPTKVKVAKPQPQPMRSACPVPNPDIICEPDIRKLRQEIARLKANGNEKKRMVMVPKAPSGIPDPRSVFPKAKPTKCANVSSKDLAEKAIMVYWDLKPHERLGYKASVEAKYSADVAQNADLHYAMDELVRTAKAYGSDDGVCLYKLRNAFWYLLRKGCTQYKGDVPDMVTILESKGLIKVLEHKLRLPEEKRLATCTCSKVKLGDTKATTTQKLVCSSGAPSDKVPGYITPLILKGTSI